MSVDLTPIFTCRQCGATDLSEAPLQIKLVKAPGGLRWKHMPCGTVVCPSCGAEPASGDVLCGACRGIVKKPEGAP